MHVPRAPRSTRDRLRRGSAFLALAAAWCGAGYAVDRLVCRAPETSAAIQIPLCVAFGVLSCALLLELAAIAGFPARSKWEFLLPAALYALLWGRHHFVDFFYWDEIIRFRFTRYSLEQLLGVLFVPVAAGHVMPLACVYWYAIYSVFGADYIGVAGASFVAAIATIAGAQALLRIVAPERPRFVALAAAALLAATPHSPIVTLWKGAGDSLLLSMATFLSGEAILAAAVFGRIAFDRRAFAWSAILLTASLLSSSILTVMPIFLLPFAVRLAVDDGQARKVRVPFLSLYGIVTAATCAYWIVRQSVLGLPFPAGAWSWSGLIGSLLGTLEMFLPTRGLVALFALGSVAMVVRLAAGAREVLLRRGSARAFDGAASGGDEAASRGNAVARGGDAAAMAGGAAAIAPTTILWLLGIQMYVAGTLEVVLARGMVYEARDLHAGYHLYLAFWGLALACASIVVAAAAGLRALAPEFPPGRKARFAGRTAVATGLAVYCAFQHLRVERLWPLLTSFPLEHACAPESLPPQRTRITVIRAREDLREDLRRYVDGAVAIAEKEQRRTELPDFALMDSPRYEDLALWPRKMDTDPKYAVEYRQMTKLGYLLRVFGTIPWAVPNLPLRLVPIEKLDRMTLATLYTDGATGPFLRKYWPQFEPDGTE